MRERRKPLPEVEEEKKEEPKVSAKAKDPSDTTPANLKEFLQQFRFKDTTDRLDWSFNTAWVLPTPIGIAMQRGWRGIVKEILADEEFLEYHRKNPDEVGRLANACFKLHVSNHDIMQVISKIYHEEPTVSIYEYFSRTLSNLYHFRQHKESLEYYLEYCYLNLQEVMPKLFEQTFTENEYQYNSKVIPKFPLQKAFDDTDTFLLRLFLNYNAKPDVDMIASVLKTEAALGDNKGKNSKLNHLYLWLEHDFENNLPILVAAVKKANIDPKIWKTPFFQLPKEHFDKFAAAFQMTNDYPLESMHLSMKQQAVMSDKLFGQIHNDRALRGTLLEGMFPWQTIRYLKKTIDDILQDPKTPAHYEKSLAILQKKIGGSLEIADSLHLFLTEKSVKQEAYAEKVESLTDLILEQIDKNKEVLIPGGWINPASPGHAVIYEIKDSKTPGKKVLLIYNTGEGLEKHFMRVENKKMYYSTVKAYEFEVDDLAHNKNRLAAIIRPLMGLAIHPAYNKSAEGMDGDKLYKQLDDLTSRHGLEEVNPEPSCKEWSKGQNSGTCAWRVWTAYTKNFEFTDGMTYKDLRYEIRTRSLNDMLKRYREKPESSTQRQLDYGLQNFALLLAQTQEDNSTAAIERRAAGLQMIEEIKLGMQSVMPVATPVVSVAAVTPLKDKLDFAFTNKTYGQLTVPAKSETKIEAVDYHAPQYAILDIADPFKAFEETLKFCREYLKTGQFGLMSNCIEKLYLAFPLDLHNKPDVLSSSYDEAAYHQYATKMAEAICKLQLMYVHAIGMQENHSFVDRSNILQYGGVIANYALHDFFVKHPLLEQPWQSRFWIDRDDDGNMSCSATINAKAEEVKKYFIEKAKLKAAVAGPKKSSAPASYSSYNSYESNPDPLEDAYLEIASPATSTDELGEMVRNDRHFVRDWVKEQKDYEGKEWRGNRSEPPVKLINTKYFYQNLYKLKTDYPECMENLRIFLLYKKLTTYMELHNSNTTTYEPLIKENWDILTEEGFENGVKASLVERHFKWKLELEKRNQRYHQKAYAPLAEIEPPIENKEYKIPHSNYNSTNAVQIDGLKNTVDEKLAVLRQLKLTRLRTKLQINATVDLMTKEFFRLKDPDIQNFCYRNLFDTGLMQQQISATPAITSSLLDIIERGLKQYITGAKVKDESLYYFKLAGSLQKVLQEMVKENLLPPSAVIQQSLARLDKIHLKLDKLIIANTKKTTTKIHDKLEKMHTYRLLMIANEVKFKNTATPETLSNYLSSFCFRKKFATKKTEDPFIMHNIQHELFRCEDLLVNYLKENDLNKFFNSVIKPLQVNLPDPDETTWENKHPIYILRYKFKDNQQTVLNLDIRTGQVEQQGRRLVAIPSEIYTSAIFQKFFSQQPPLSAYYNFDQNTYEFEHENRKYIYYLNSQQAFSYLKQFINGEWYTLQPGSLLIGTAKDKPEYSLPISEYGNDRWCEAGRDDELIINRKTHKTLYAVIPQGSIVNRRYAIKQADDNGKFTHTLLIPQAKENFTKEQAWIERFEGNKFTEISINPTTNLHLLKFPRYGLEFQETKNGDTTVWVYTKDPRYKIIPDITHAIPQINAYLHLTADAEHGLDDIIFMPKQQFYKSIKPNIEYIGLEFDNQNYLTLKKLSAKREAFDPEKYQVRNSEEVVTYGYSKTKGLILHQPQDNLYLSYLSLVKRDAPNALLQLQQFYRSNATIGIDELNWLQRILEEIPARTTNESINTEHYQLNAPEILAVRAYAAFILAKASLNKGLPDLKAEAQRLQATADTINREIKLAQVDFLTEFCEKLSTRITTPYSAYLSKLPKVAANLKLNPRQEEIILRHIINSTRLDVALQFRLNELNLEFLHQEAEDLSSLQNTPAFTDTKQARLAQVHDQIAQQLGLNVSETVLDEEEVAVIPSQDFQLISPHIRELLVSPPNPASIHCYGMVDDQYLRNFNHFIDTIYHGDSAALKILKDESNLNLKIVANKLHNKSALSWTDNLKILVSYVLNSPEVFAGKNFDADSLAQHLQTVVQIQKKKDLVVSLATTKVNEPDVGKIISSSVKLAKRLPKQKRVYELKMDPVLQQAQVDITNEIALDRDTNLSEETKLEIASNHFLTTQKATELLDYFSEQGVADTNKLAELEKGILEWANRPPKDAAEKAHWELTGHSRQRLPLAMKDVLHLYLMQDQTLFEKHTNLAAAELPQFYQNVLHFLVTATDHQHNEKITAKLKKIVHEPNSIHNVKTKTDTGKLILQERAANLIHEPRMLLFEYLDNKRIFTKQYEFMHELLDTSQNPEGRFENLVQQLIMGGGKSKVLLPILCLAKATGTNISAVIVPEALYNIYVADLSNKTQEIFNKKPFSFTFNEQVECDEAYLENLYRSMINVMIDREYLITTKQSVQSLQLHFIKLLHSNKPEDAHKRQLLNSIMNLFKYQTDALADEVHAALDTRQELIYTLGEGERISAPILEFVLEMYEAFHHVPLPHAQGFNLNDVVNEKVRITSEQYDALTPGIARMMIQNTHSPLAKICQQFNPEQQEQLIQYLLEKDKPDFIKELPAADKDFLALTKQQINQVLGLTLTRNLNEHFGLPKVENKNDQPKLPVPYVASNTPSTSEFGNYIEIMNYTRQLYRDKIPEHIVKEFIDQHLRAMQTELEVNNQNDPYSARFLELTGWKLAEHDFTDPDVFNKFNAEVGGKKAFQKYCLLNYIMSEIVRNTITLTNTSQNFAGLLHTFQGVSGTPWNLSTYPLFMKLFTQLNDDIDAQVIANLNKAPLPPLLLTSKATSALDMIPQLLRNLTDPKFMHAWIDIGAYFRGIDNAVIATTFVNTFADMPTMQHLKYVLCFNNKDQLLAYPTPASGLPPTPILLENPDALSIQNKLNCTPDDYYTYYDQRHITGTDITQAPAAKAFVPIGLKTLLHDLLQGVMRMRGLGSGQEIQFVIDKELQDAYPDMKWDVNDIIAFCTQNTDKRLGDDNFKAAMHKMHNVIWLDCYCRLLAAKTDPERTQAFANFQKVFITINNKSPYDQYGDVATLTPTADILAKYKTTLLQIWQEAVTTSPPENVLAITDKLDEVITDAVQHCPEFIEHNQNDETMDTQVNVATALELEAQSMLETRKETEQELTNAKNRYVQYRREFSLSNDPALAQQKDITSENLFILPIHYAPNSPPFILTLEAALAKDNITKNWQFSPNISVTANFINTIQEQVHMLDVAQKDPAIMLIEHDSVTDEIKFLILAPEDAEVFQKCNITPKQGNKTFWIETVHGVPYWGSKPMNLPNTFQQGIQQIALLAGDTDILNATYQPGSWLGEQSREKLDFLQHYILPQHPDKLNLLDRLKETMLKAAFPVESFQASESPQDVSSEEKEALHNTEPIVQPFFVTRRPSIKILPESKASEPKHLSHSEVAQSKEYINAMVAAFIEFTKQIKTQATLPSPIKHLVDKINLVCINFHETHDEAYQHYYKKYFILVEKLLFLTETLAKLHDKSPELNAFIKEKFMPHFGQVLKEEKISTPAIPKLIKATYNINTATILSLDKRSQRSIPLTFIHNSSPQVYADMLQFEALIQTKLTDLSERLQKIPYEKEPEKVSNYVDKRNVLFSIRDSALKYIDGNVTLEAFALALEEQIGISQKIAHVGWRHSILGSDSDTTTLLKQLQTTLETHVPPPKKPDFFR